MMRGELRAVRPEASGDARDSIDHGDGLDLDVRTLFQLDDADAGGRRRILVPDLATNAVENRPLVLSIGEVHRHLDHVLEATAAVRTDSHLHLHEDPPDLAFNVALEHLARDRITPDAAGLVDEMASTHARCVSTGGVRRLSRGAQ